MWVQKGSSKFPDSILRLMYKMKVFAMSYQLRSYTTLKQKRNINLIQFDIHTNKELPVKKIAFSNFVQGNEVYRDIQTKNKRKIKIAFMGCFFQLR